MDKRVDTLTDAQLKWSTPVDVGRSRVRVSFHNPLLMLGSCFADNIGGRMRTVGFDALVNPLGTMY
ncbi:MAG: GSCFA domain-containing protein, partial [Marinilabiliaceae bacterium]